MRNSASFFMSHFAHLVVAKCPCQRQQSLALLLPSPTVQCMYVCRTKLLLLVLSSLFLQKVRCVCTQLACSPTQFFLLFFCNPFFLLRLFFSSLPDSSSAKLPHLGKLLLLLLLLPSASKLLTTFSSPSILPSVHPSWGRCPPEALFQPLRLARLLPLSGLESLKERTRKRKRGESKRKYWLLLLLL